MAVDATDELVVKYLLEEDSQQLLDSYQFEGLLRGLQSRYSPSFLLHTPVAAKLSTTLMRITGCDASDLLDYFSTISFAAFARSPIAEIHIPSSITSIGDYAFDGCTSLESITYSSTAAQFRRIKKARNWHGEKPVVVYCADKDLIYGK